MYDFWNWLSFTDPCKDSIKIFTDINLEDHLIYQNNVLSKLLQIILDQPAGKCLEINII